MRQDDVCLREMLSAVDQLIELQSRADAQELFLNDRLFRHSVLFEFVVIGEEVAQLSDALKLNHPEVPWPKISAFRHRVAHGYFALSLEIVWMLCVDEIPKLRVQLRNILAIEA